MDTLTLTVEADDSLYHQGSPPPGPQGQRGSMFGRYFTERYLWESIDHSGRRAKRLKELIRVTEHDANRLDEEELSTAVCNIVIE
jgi:hypothetical protein